MNPSQAKHNQHERYDSVAVQVALGRDGYKPAVKSPLSKSAGNKFAQDIHFA